MFDFENQPGKKSFQKRSGDGLQPLVSIVTPFYNAQTHFEQTYRCVMNQTFPWYEWIIVDDGSDQSEARKLLNALPCRDERIHVLHQENKRQAAARNLAIAQAKSDIIVPLDADDLIAPTYLERTYFGLTFNPEYAWCYTDSVGFDSQCYEWIKEFSSARMRSENVLTCTAAIRRDALLQVGGYTEGKGIYDEDWELWLKLLAAGYAPVHLPEPDSFWYRRSDNGMQKNVQMDQAARQRSETMISTAAKNVPDDITAKIYPRGDRTGLYTKPVCLPWNRKVWPVHRKRHILMLLPWTEMGGADLFYLDVLRRLDKDRFEITILTTQLAQNTWHDRFAEWTPDILNLPSFLDESNYTAFISYVIQSRETDILFLSNSYYGYMAAPWLRKTFPETVILDYVHMEEWYWRNGGFARTSGMLEGITDKTLVCNEATRRVMIESFGRSEESVQTLYIGVDHHYFDPEKISRDTAREKHGIKSGRPIILFPCRVHPQKRPFLMLEIAKKVYERWPEAAFLVVGDGPQLQELQIKTKDTGLAQVIYFAGRQSDMRPYYRDAAMTLICSLKEGLALTAYESMSMGTPVITSDVGGQAELVTHKTGAVLPLLQTESEDLDARIFDPQETEQYVQTILRIGHMDVNAYKQMCASCRERIEESFSSEKMIERLQTLMEDLSCNQKSKEGRHEAANALRKNEALADELVTLYSEIDAYEFMYKNHFVSDTKNELMRLANSKWGSRLLKLVFKLKINKLFR